MPKPNPPLTLKALDELERLLAKAAPRPWTTNGDDGGGHRIEARIPDLDRAADIQQVSIRPHVQIGESGEVWVLVAYESYNQFPSKDWSEMQVSNRDAIVLLANHAEALTKIARAARERELNCTCECPYCQQERGDPDAEA